MKIGITGGIGSGKSTVCAIFSSLGIPVYSSDDRAKALMTDSPALVERITDIFGPDAYRPDGTLDRAVVAAQAFTDRTKLDLLSAAVHPAVAADYEAWHTAHAHAPYTLKEAALIVESGSYRTLDALIVVTAPMETRIQRVMARDGADRTSVEARIKNQLPESELLAKANFEIVNDGQRLLLPQVWHVHRELEAIRQNKAH